MKFTRLALTAVAAAALALPVASTAVSAAAHQSAGINDQRYVCLKNTSGLCLDASGSQVQVDNGVVYDVVQFGTVSSSGTWPFQGGTGWNSRYNGNAVVAAYPANNVDYCLRQSGFIKGSTQVYNQGENCALYDEDFWVVSGDWLINVNQTNLWPSSGPPAVLNAGCASHGCKVWSTMAGNTTYNHWAF